MQWFIKSSHVLSKMLYDDISENLNFSNFTTYDVWPLISYHNSLLAITLLYRKKTEKCFSKSMNNAVN